MQVPCHCSDHHKWHICAWCFSPTHVTAFMSSLQSTSQWSLLSALIHLEGPGLLTTWGPACAADKLGHIAAVTRPSTHWLQSTATSDCGQLIVRISVYQPHYQVLELKLDGKSLGGMRDFWPSHPEVIYKPFLVLTNPLQGIKHTRPDRESLRQSCRNVQKITWMFSFPER